MIYLKSQTLNYRIFVPTEKLRARWHVQSHDGSVRFLPTMDGIHYKTKSMSFIQLTAMISHRVFINCFKLTKTCLEPLQPNPIGKEFNQYILHLKYC